MVVIDLNSESSKDSVEDDSKYNVTSTASKKQELKNKNADLNGSSDSEESIFEVPVPPKPKPPLIELKDSDNSDLDSDDDKHEYLHSKQKEILQSNEILLQQKSSTDEIYEIDSDSNESDNLVLNCTEIQKGVSSISEIKRLNTQESNKVEPPETLIKAQNHLTEKSDFFNFKKPVQPASQTQIKSTNYSNKNDFVDSQKVNDSNEAVNLKRKNISLEEYFFQPMTHKMKSFYNDSWGGENFDVNQLKKEMSCKYSVFLLIKFFFSVIKR